jgi:hypothetical protein
MAEENDAQIGEMLSERYPETSKCRIRCELLLTMRVLLRGVFREQQWGNRSSSFPGIAPTLPGLLNP